MWFKKTNLVKVTAKLTSLAVIFVFAVSFANAQVPDKLKPFLDGAVAHAEANSLYRKGIDFVAVKAEMYRLAKDAKTVEELAPALRYLLSVLKDSHGRFFYNNKTIAYWFGEPKPHQKKIDGKIWTEMQSGKYKFSSAMLADRTGYVRIPGMPMGDNVAMSKEIRDAVCGLAKQKAKRWIVDLRYNSGGNMYPMMEGLGSLIGDGTVGKVADLGGNAVSVWSFKDADFYYDDYLAADLENNCAFKKPPKVAVLISQYTASSGEALAVVFKGRPNTRFFGLETAGMVTVTDWTPINKDMTAAISIGYYADRNGTVYRDFVPPDEQIESVLTGKTDGDAVIAKALVWLKK